MKNPWFRFVVVLVLVLLFDFAGDFEDEDDDENEEDGGSGYFSHRLWSPRPREFDSQHEKRKSFGSS